MQKEAVQNHLLLPTLMENKICIEAEMVPSPSSVYCYNSLWSNRKPQFSFLFIYYIYTYDLKMALALAYKWYINNIRLNKNTTTETTEQKNATVKSDVLCWHLSSLTVHRLYLFSFESHNLRAGWWQGLGLTEPIWHACLCIHEVPISNSLAQPHTIKVNFSNARCCILSRLHLFFKMFVLNVTQ